MSFTCNTCKKISITCNRTSKGEVLAREHRGLQATSLFVSLDVRVRSGVAAPESKAPHMLVSKKLIGFSAADRFPSSRKRSHLTVLKLRTLRRIFCNVFLLLNP